MHLIFRCLTIVSWLSIAATVAWLALSNTGPVGDAFGVRGSQTVFTVLITTIATCSGLILWREWRDDPAGESEYGEWTNKQLFYAIVFAISFFVASNALAGWYFAA
jgi:hypothetical protein